LNLIQDELNALKRQDKMHIKYYTQKGSVYIHTFEESGDYWIKEDTAGQIHSLAGGLHISKNKLQELVREYPSTLLDKTYCFDMGVEKEFFDDAKREQFDGVFNAEDTVILFMVKREQDRYGIGCSSRVVKIEKTD
jgi:hypothetical protein